MRLLKTKRQKIIAVVAVVFAILVIGAFAYIEILVTALGNLANNPAIPGPRISGYLNAQGVLSYYDGRYEYPYLTVVYTASNASQIYANATIYKNPIPTHVYIFNLSGECYGCGNYTKAVNSLIAGIKGYGMDDLYANTSYISAGNLNQIQNNSILVVLNGYIPYELAENNFTPMESLLDRGTSIIYVGLNFSSMVVSGTSAEREITDGMPRFLNTKPAYGSAASGGPFAFNTPTFIFVNGTTYHFIDYTNYSNGSVVVFANNLAAWPSEQQAGSDIAKAIWMMFWLPRYNYGSSIGTVLPGGYGSIGVVMNATAMPYNLTLPSTLNSGYLRVVVEAAPSYAGKQPAYMYMEGQPQIGTRGTISLQPTIQPNASDVNITFNVTYAPLKAKNFSAYIGFYNQNLSSVFAVPGTLIHAFHSVIRQQNIGLGPGRYIVMLRNFTDNTSIAGGYFVIPPYDITVPQWNFTSGFFEFRITSGGIPIKDVPYNISIANVNGSSASGVVTAGILEYTVPKGIPVPNPINITISMLGQTYRETYGESSLPFTISSQYIEVGVVLIMIIIMIVFVRAPPRDEFYVDVPNLPESKKIEIRIKASEVLSVFDKLNANYHWKYMPLSKTEIKSAIALNIKYNNIPVELTYRNIDSLLDSLLVNKYIVGADELYAPATWTDASKHDIEYLTSFKKLRIYFVTHSYTFTDLDVSDEADVTAMLHGDKRYVVIYSATSRFKNIPVYPQSRTYLVFLNGGAMEDFKAKLYSTASANAEKLKMYISADYIRLVDGDDIGKSIG